MQCLHKKQFSKYGGGEKYYIDCTTYAQNSDSIEIQDFIRYTKKSDIAVLTAVANDETIKKKNRHIVVKIGPTNRVTKEEFYFGKRLSETKIPGFIKYICLFSCYDDTKAGSTYIEPNKIKICSASAKTEKNRKDVLVMPLIQEGSFDNYQWTNEDIPLLKCLMIQSVLSLGSAFETAGFIHGDSHLGNILFKKTKSETITYSFHGKARAGMTTIQAKALSFQMTRWR